MRRNLNRLSFACREDRGQRAGKTIVFGIMLVLIGGCFLLMQAGYIENRSIERLWPLILCVFGFNRLVFASSDYARIKGALQIFLGFWVFACLDHLWGWTFVKTWPMILIATGLCYIASYLFRDRHDNHESQSETQS